MRAILRIKAMKNFLDRKSEITATRLFLYGPRENAGYFYGKPRGGRPSVNIKSLLFYKI